MHTNRRFLPASLLLATVVFLSPAAQCAESASAGSANGWRSALRGELARCEQLSFFKRQACTEKARWKYCSKPGRSDSAPECGNGESRSTAGQPAPSWVPALRAELAQCEKLGYFKSQACIEKARWKHCRDRWEQAEECGRKQSGNRDGSAPGL